MNLLHIHEGAFVFSADAVWDLVLDALLDSLKAFPFILVAFLIIEFIEHHSGSKLQNYITHSDKSGPLVGALLGCFPQCGFSVLCSNLYAGGLLTVGTLLAVYLSTSDEAVILMLAHPNRYKDILFLLLCKVVIALCAGYFFDFIFRKKAMHNPGRIIDLCDQDHCGCHDADHDTHAHHGIFVPALIHSVKIWGFLAVFTLILNFLVAFIGTEKLSAILLANSILQPFFAALLGFIPNCAASVLLTELYLEGVLSFGSVLAGLCTSAGAGLLVLFRENRRPKDNLKIMGMLYVAGILPGLLLHAISLFA